MFSFTLESLYSSATSAPELTRNSLDRPARIQPPLHKTTPICPQPNIILTAINQKQGAQAMHIKSLPGEEDQGMLNVHPKLFGGKGSHVSHLEGRFEA